MRLYDIRPTHQTLWQRGQSRAGARDPSKYHKRMGEAENPALAPIANRTRNERQTPRRKKEWGVSNTKSKAIWLKDGELLRSFAGGMHQWVPCAICQRGRWAVLGGGKLKNAHCVACSPQNRAHDIVGKRYGRLVVLRRGPARPNSRCVIWECRCDCGTFCALPGNYLKSGTQSCGCLHREITSQRQRTHGRCNTTEYQIWCSMIQRCRNPKNTGYRNYGGRGVTVCEAWTKFETFLADMGLRPAGLTIDRINNDGNYEPDNCRWATQSEQALNSRPSIAKRMREAANANRR